MLTADHILVLRCKFVCSLCKWVYPIQVGFSNTECFPIIHVGFQSHFPKSIKPIFVLFVMHAPFQVYPEQKMLTVHLFFVAISRATAGPSSVQSVCHEIHPPSKPSSTVCCTVLIHVRNCCTALESLMLRLATLWRNVFRLSLSP